ncbi:MAG: hypothetical protein WBA13_13110 [Microcoleaceae cyanobacterium]
MIGQNSIRFYQKITSFEVVILWRFGAILAGDPSQLLQPTSYD